MLGIFERQRGQTLHGRVVIWKGRENKVSCDYEHYKSDKVEHARTEFILTIMRGD